MMNLRANSMTRKATGCEQCCDGHEKRTNANDVFHIIMWSMVIQPSENAEPHP